MKVSLLGPFAVSNGPVPVHLQRPRQRALLAILALHANRPVQVESIIDLMWGYAPPPAVRNQIQVHVSHIRKALRACGAPDVLETHPAGYLLRLAPAASDVGIFAALESVGEAAVKEHRYQAAAEAFRLGLRAWRGPALAGVEAAFVRDEARLLEERRRVVFRRWVDLELGLGRPEPLLPPLFNALRREPLDEGICLRLMAALQRAGRTADALEVYRTSRRLLRQELGIDPNEKLQVAESAILRGELVQHAEWRLLDLGAAVRAG
ncbi:MAG TPA: AfsR/SARP family transcriptional regulator [Pilimelia sp.]|nr:AfsR/SARP family transcriptional regulator [Pilimelia sp.]